MPRSSAHTSTSATVWACTRSMPAAQKICATNDFRSSGFIERKMKRQPIAQDIQDEGIAFAEKKVIHPGDEVQVGRLARVHEEIDRLLGGRHRVFRRMQQEQR